MLYYVNIIILNYTKSITILKSLTLFVCDIGVKIPVLNDIDLLFPNIRFMRLIQSHFVYCRIYKNSMKIRYTCRIVYHINNDRTTDTETTNQSIIIVLMRSVISCLCLVTNNCKKRGGGGGENLKAFFFCFLSFKWGGGQLRK